MRALGCSGLLLEGHVLIPKSLGSLGQDALGLVQLSCYGLCPATLPFSSSGKCGPAASLCNVTAIISRTSSKGIPMGSVIYGSPGQHQARRHHSLALLLLLQGCGGSQPGAEGGGRTWTVAVDSMSTAMLCFCPQAAMSDLPG